MFLISIIVVFSMSYIFAIEWYDQMPNQIAQLFEKVSLKEIKYNEIGIELSGIQYENELTSEALKDMNSKMVANLAHQSNCSKLCQVTHNHLVTTFFEEEDTSRWVQTNENEEEWNYTFSIKNQQDIHYNTYYNLKIKGYKDIERLDMLTSRGRNQFKEWHVNTKESIYFKGEIPGKCSSIEVKEISDRLFEALNAKHTNYYEDDLIDSTCVYYGYTSYFKDYIKETDGDKTNMQVGFKYNDELNCTEVIVAFPFYNMPF